MINRVVLVGRLARNPELRKTPNNASVVSFTVALDNRTKDVNGERTTSFIPCVCWNALADNVQKYTKKGSLVGVEGRLNQRTYKRTDGSTVSVVEVIADNVQFLGPKSDSNVASIENEVKTTELNFDNNESASIDITEDDLPF